MSGGLFVQIHHRSAVYRVRSDRIEAVRREIRRQRSALERYIALHPHFRRSLVPVEVFPEAPRIAQRMARASRSAGVGPMAAVAGTIAEEAALAALRAGAREAIVDNGGDIYLSTDTQVTVALFAGASRLSGRIALLIDPERMPLAVCSSSATMGHSMSFGRCDLATVVSRDAALADAVATFACNSVSNPSDIERVLDEVTAIPEVDGVLLVLADQVGMAGRLPRLVRNPDLQILGKIARHPSAVIPQSEGADWAETIV